jgi:deazaflavin-dependent oxidoreductase (nitroreductase family)
MPNARWLLALVTRVHRALYRLSGGRVGGNLAGIRVLLLTTLGRRSGLPRALPLLYIEAENGYVVVASNAGDDRDPDWWKNLLARPEASVQVGRERHAVRARRATPEEEAALWPKLIAAYGPYARYRERTRRVIPVVVLERAWSRAANG